MKDAADNIALYSCIRYNEIKNGGVMKQQHIDRINELACKAKTAEGLTKEEHAEREELRKAYIAEFRQSLQAQLDNTYIVDHQGNKKKLERKNGGGKD